jgi:hypothetical protein
MLDILRVLDYDLCQLFYQIILFPNSRRFYVCIQKLLAKILPIMIILIKRDSYTMNLNKCGITNEYANSVT